MAGKAFNLTAQLNLVGPNNIKPVVGKIKRELSGIKANVNLSLEKNASRNIKAIKGEVQKLNTELLQTAKLTGTVSNSLKTMAASAKSAQTSTASLSSTAKDSRSSIKDVDKSIQDASFSMRDFGEQSRLAVKRFLAFSVAAAPLYALTRAISRAFDEFVNFDKELTRLVQVSGKSRASLKGLTIEISNLSTNLGVSSNELISISTTLAQAGLSIGQTTIALEALAKAALAPTFDDLNRTVEGSIALMRQFGISTNQLEGALGSINAVAASFAVEAGDIISAIQRTGGVFAAASNGVSQGTDALNEFVAVFTSVRATTRESAETIATGLRTIFTRIQRGSTIDFLREMGVQLTDAEGKFIGPYKAIERLSGALRRLDPRDLKFSQIVEELGGFRQIGKVIPLIQQFTTAQQALKVAQEGQGSLAKDAITAQQSLAVQVSKVREEFVGFVRSIGESKTFQVVTKFVLGFASSLISVGKAFKPILPFLAILGAIKGTKLAIDFGSGLLGGGKGKGGAGGAGAGGGSSGGGAGPQKGIDPSAIKANTDASTRNSEALMGNTGAINSLTEAINTLKSQIGSSPQTSGSNTILGADGQPLAFASGGSVPGTGNSDTVPAMLTPGEFVIRKKAVSKIGVDKLNSINKYSDGGNVYASKKSYGMLIADEGDPPDHDLVRATIPDAEGNKNQYVAPVSVSGFTRTKDYQKQQKKLPKAIDSMAKELSKSIGGKELEASSIATSKALTATAAGKLFEGYVLAASNMKDPGTDRFDIPTANSDIQGLTTQPISDFTDVKISDSPPNRKSIIEKAVAEDRKSFRKSNTIPYERRGRPRKYNLGGYIRKYEDGATVEGRTLQEKLLEQIASYGRAAGIKDILDIPSGDREIGKLLNANNVKQGKNLDQVEEILSRVAAAKGKKAQADADRVGQLDKVGVVGLVDTNNQLGYSKDFEWKLPDANKTVLAKVRGFKQRYMDAVRQMQKETSESAMTLADNVQYADIFGDGDIAFDFDKTLVKNAEILDSNGNDDIPSYSNRDKVEEALKGATLTRLGNKLKSLTQANPDFIKSTRILTARPQGTADLLSKTLQRLGLPYDTGSITGVGGTDSDVSQGKAENLSKLEKLVDDNANNVGAALKAGKQATQYSEPRAFGTELDEKLGQGLIEGAVVEKALFSLGANLPSLDQLEQNRAIDFPSGLGSAAKFFGIDPDIPTEVKRTLDASAFKRARGEFARFFKPAEFAEGGSVRQNIETEDGSSLIARFMKDFSSSGEVAASSIGGGLYSVTASQASGGGGRSLYDAVMEMATAKGGSLVSDRSRVSQDALTKIWGNYYNKGAGQDGKPVGKSVVSPKNMYTGSLMRDEDYPSEDPSSWKGEALPLQYAYSKFAKGGSVEDKVPALLTPGEFVVNKKAATRLGANTLNKLNHADTVQGFNKGGAVGYIQKLSIGGYPEDSTDEIKAAIDKMVNDINKEIVALYRQAGKKLQVQGNTGETGTKEVDGKQMDSSSRKAYYAMNPSESGNELLERYARENFQVSKRTQSWLKKLSGDQAKAGEKNEVTGFRSKYSTEGGFVNSVQTGRKSSTKEKDAERYDKMMSDVASEAEKIATLEQQIIEIRTHGLESIKKQVQSIKEGASKTTASPVGSGTNNMPPGVNPPDPPEPPETIKPGQNPWITAAKVPQSETVQAKNPIEEKAQATGNALDKLKDKFNVVAEKLGGTTAALSLMASTLATQLPELYKTIDRFAGSELAQSEVAAGIAGGIQQGGASAMAGIKLAKESGMSNKGVAATGAATAIGGAVTGYLEAQSLKREENLDRFLKESNANFEKALNKLQTDSTGMSTADREREERQAYAELGSQLDALGTPMENATVTWETQVSRAASAMGTFAQTLAALSMIRMGMGGGGGGRPRRRRGRRGFADGGIVYASDGMLVDYTPKGTDTIPAMLSPGEFVVNAKSTKKNRGLLSSINKNKGGSIGSSRKIKYLQDGSDEEYRAGSELHPRVADALDVIQMQSESTAVNIASAGTQSVAAGMIPFAGAGIDYTSAAANFSEGNVVDGSIDALFGTIDLVTDAIQTATYATGAGAPVAAVGGAGVQVATDATQAGLKKAVKEFGPAVAKGADEAFTGAKIIAKESWQSATKYAADAADATKKNFSSAVDATKKGFSDAGTYVAKKWDATVDAAGDFAVKSYDKAAKGIADAGTTISKKWTEAGDAVKSGWSNASAFVSKKWSQAGDFIFGKGGKKAAGNAAGDAAQQGGKGFFGKIGTQLAQLLPGVVAGAITAGGAAGGGGASEEQRRNQEKRNERLDQLRKMAELEAKKMKTSDINNRVRSVSGMSDSDARTAKLTGANNPMEIAAQRAKLEAAGVDSRAGNRRRIAERAQAAQQKLDRGEDLTTGEQSAVQQNKMMADAINEMYQDAFSKGFTGNEIQKENMIGAGGSDEAIAAEKKAEQNVKTGKDELDGLSDEEKELLKTRRNMMRIGKRYIGNQNEQILLQERQNRLMNEAKTASENFIAAMQTMQSGIKRATDEFNVSMTKIDNAVGIIDGKIPKVDRSAENLFGNLEAYTPDEVKKASREQSATMGLDQIVSGIRTSREGGVEEITLGKQLEESALAQQTLERELPRIFRENAGTEDSSNVRKEIEAALVASGMNEQSAQEMSRQVANAAQRQTDTGNSVSWNKLSEDVPGLLDNVKSLKEATAMQQALAKAQNDALDQINSQLNAASDRMAKAVQLRADAEKTMADMDLQLQQATSGYTVSLEDMNKPFNVQMEALTRGTDVNNPAGTANLEDLLSRRDKAQGEMKRLEETQAGVNMSGDRDAIIAHQKAMKDNSVAVKTSNAALNKFATDSTRAANAMNKVQDLVQVRQARQNFMLEDLSNMDNPEFMLNRADNARSIDKVESGTASARDIQNVAKEFQTIMAMRDPEERDSFKKSFIQQAAQNSGYSEKELERAFDPASDPVVIQAREIAKGYAEEQATAQKALAADQERAAKIMTDGVVDSAIGFRRTILDAAKTAAAELRGASENAMFTSNEMGGGFTTGILENSTAAGSMATIQAGLAAQGTGGPGDGAVSLDTSAMRDILTGAVEGMDQLDNAQLSKMVGSGAVTTSQVDEDGNQIDLKKMLQDQGIGAVKDVLGDRENESMVSVDPDLLSDIIEGGQLSFNQEQLALLSENGVIRFDFAGMQELKENNLIKIDGEGLTRLEDILARYQTFTQNNGGGGADGMATGGVVYASQGKMIGMKPKGTDTVPAMLTPGEFVINKKATSKNLGLLRAINTGRAGGYSEGGVVYLADGSSDPVGSNDENISEKSAFNKDMKKRMEGKLVQSVQFSRGANRMYINAWNSPEKDRLMEQIEAVFGMFGFGHQEGTKMAGNPLFHDLNQLVADIPQPITSPIMNDVINRGVETDAAEALIGIGHQAYDRWHEKYERIISNFLSRITDEDILPQAIEKIPAVSSPEKDFEFNPNFEEDQGTNIETSTKIKKKEAVGFEKRAQAAKEEMGSGGAEVEIPKPEEKLMTPAEITAFNNEDTAATTDSPDYYSYGTYARWLKNLIQVMRKKERRVDVNGSPIKDRFTFDGSTLMSKDGEIGMGLGKKGDIQDDIRGKYTDLLVGIKDKSESSTESLQHMPVDYKQMESAVDARELLAQDAESQHGSLPKDRKDLLGFTGFVLPNIVDNFLKSVQDGKLWNNSGGWALANHDGLYEHGLESYFIPNMLQTLRDIGQVLGQANVGEFSPDFAESLDWINSTPTEASDRETRIAAQKELGIETPDEGATAESQYKRASNYWGRVDGVYQKMMEANHKKFSEAEGFARGGHIFRPRGTDTVPAMLTPGEFVVNRSATQKNLGLLRQINGNPNTKYFSRGGAVQYLADGSKDKVKAGSGISAISIDFSAITTAMDTFKASVGDFIGSAAALAAPDFGVFNAGVIKLENTLPILENSVSNLNAAAATLGQNIGNVASLVNALSTIPSSIELRGRIDMPTSFVVSLEGQTAGVDIDIKKEILNTVADKLEANNVQFNVEGLRQAANN